MGQEYLYKYLDIKGALSMIANKELQFSNPENFNDPFDCHPGLFDYTVPENYSEGWLPNSFIQDKAKSDAVNERQRAWVCSLSKRYDSLLMWSYYANHIGVCIALKKDIHSDYLAKSSLGQMFMDNVEVNYRNILDKPNGINCSPLLYQLSTKSTQWQHEQEVRHIIINPHPWIPCRIGRRAKKNDVIPWTEVKFYPKLSDECFGRIYLGAKICVSDEIKILKAVKDSLPNMKVFQMIPDYENFSFIEEPVDIDIFLAQHKEKKNLLEMLRSCFPHHNVKKRLTFTL